MFPTGAADPGRRPHTGCPVRPGGEFILSRGTYRRAGVPDAGVCALHRGAAEFARLPSGARPWRLLPGPYRLDLMAMRLAGPGAAAVHRGLDPGAGPGTPVQSGVRPELHGHVPAAPP